jgi:hypothetical protein
VVWCSVRDIPRPWTGLRVPHMRTAEPNGTRHWGKEEMTIARQIMTVTGLALCSCVLIAIASAISCSPARIVAPSGKVGGAGNAALAAVDA